MDPSKLPPSLSGKTLNQLKYGRMTPAQRAELQRFLKEHPVEHAHSEVHERQLRVERIGAQRPSEPVTISVGDESIDLGDRTRFPDPIENRQAWLSDLQSKIPPPEEHIEQVRFNGEGFSLHNEAGDKIPWDDNQDERFGKEWR